MKKVILFFTVLFALLLTACGAENVPEPQDTPDLTPPSPVMDEPLLADPETPREPAASPAYEGNGFYGFPIERQAVYEEQTVDLDHCGTEETVQLLQVFDEYDQDSFALRVIKNGQHYDTVSPCRFDPSMWISDLDQNGECELFLCGDTGSDDYTVYGWKLTDQGLSSLTEQENGWVMSGEIKRIAETEITIRNYLFVLSSRYFLRTFTYDEQNGFLPTAVWETDTSVEARSLTVSNDLPVTIDGAPAVLPVGTVLQIDAYDGDLCVWFHTEEGLSGYLTLEPVGDRVFEEPAFWCIDGMPEYHYFENLMYAG